VVFSSPDSNYPRAQSGARAELKLAGEHAISPASTFGPPKELTSKKEREIFHLEESTLGCFHHKGKLIN